MKNSISNGIYTYSMSKTFALYHPNINNLKIIVGTNGFRMDQNDDNGSLKYVSIMFDDIRYVSPVTHLQDNISSFKISASSLEYSHCNITHEIKVSGSIKELYELITQGYNQAQKKRDILLGIF